jgi:hypothetical protein
VAGVAGRKRGGGDAGIVGTMQTTAMPTTLGPRILSIGLHPRALDYTQLPAPDEATLTARIAAGRAALAAAGFDVVHCQLGISPDDAETQIRHHLTTAGPFGVAMIGAGLRAVPPHTLLFERVVNIIAAHAPGIRFCFNVSPEDTATALRRWVQPGAAG